MLRKHIPTSEELRDMLIADAALTVAFAILLSGANTAAVPSFCAGASGIMGLLCKSSLLFFIPIAFVGVSLSFILHEYMHKLMAQHYGAIAAFRRSDMGILIALGTSFLGFLMALPGATMIYTSSFTTEQDGYTSIVGPLTNFAVFAVFFAIYLALPPSYQGSYLGSMVDFTMFIALWLAFVNMLPIYPLDGSKVLKWNKPVYAVLLILLFGLLYYLEGPGILLSIAIVFILSLVLSAFSRGILFYR